MESTTFIATTNPNALKPSSVDRCYIKTLRNIFEKNIIIKQIFNNQNPNYEILQDSSYDDYKSDKVAKAYGGLVSTFVRAYCEHHEIIIRPDDIWQSIITQFSFFVSANSEALRNHFVSFPDKKTLVVIMEGSLRTVDYGIFVEKMVNEEIINNIKDPEFVEWLLPNFTTTTPKDRITASISIMATLKTYFDYVCFLRCGIPKVTLEGTINDWIKLKEKINRLKDYDINGYMIKWHSLLVRILDKFIDCIKGNVDMTFWDSICKLDDQKSGTPYLDGWVTSFCVFTNRGDWQGNIKNENSWPHVDFLNLPLGITSVPVLVIEGINEYKTHMIVGQAAHEICGLNETCLRPRSDWCIILDNGNADTINTPPIEFDKDDDDY
jgi:hypothetical protein